MSNRTPLIEEARSRRGDTVQLGIDRFPRCLKRAVALQSMNEGTTMREIVIRALEREVGLEPVTSPRKSQRRERRAR